MADHSEESTAWLASEVYSRQSEEKRKARQRLTLITWGSCGLAVVLIALAAYFPLYRQQAFLSKLKAGGAKLITNYNNDWGQHDVSLWLQSNIGIGLPLQEEVRGIDFDSYPLDDATLQAVTGWEEIAMLSMNRAEISAAALDEFVQQAPNLSYLQVINCPAITPDHIREYRKHKPALTVEYRGTAFLGIRGYDTPEGCMVFYIQRGSGALKAGLQYGDIITAFEGKPIKTFQELVESIGECEPRQIVEVTVRREEKERTLSCELGGWESGNL